jgi:integrase
MESGSFVFARRVTVKYARRARQRQRNKTASSAGDRQEEENKMKQRGVFERKQGEWWIRYTDAQGRYRREKAGTWAAARDLYVKRKNDALVGRKLPEKLRHAPVLFDEIARDALEYSRLHKRSYKSDCARMKKLIAWFGNRPADSIDADDVENHLTGEAWKPATMNRLRALLSLTYRLAIRAGKAKENPARNVRHARENNGRIRFLSPEEEKRLRETIARKFPERLPEFDLALHTGLRLGEQYGARWEHVDFEHRTLTVPRDKSGRTSHVSLNDAALRALLELRRIHTNSEAVCGDWKTPREWFAIACRDSGVSDFTWHCLRHTFASRLVMSGADLRTVAEALRDTTLGMVMRYSHLAPDYRLAAVKRMEAFFPNRTDTTIAPLPKNGAIAIN